MEKNINNTQFFTVQKEPELQVSDVLEIVYKALKEKGYNPVNQIVGYIMSGDPTYITSHNNARSLIMKVERDELVEEVLKTYIENSADRLWHVLRRLLQSTRWTGLCSAILKT